MTAEGVDRQATRPGGPPEPGAVPDDAVVVEGLRHAYGTRTALAGVSFTVRRGEAFGLLGPNGGGKTTLFRILATLFPPSGGGSARILGHDAVRETRVLRRKLGVVFQSPALDARLTVRENLRHQGRLYGLGGGALAARIDTLLSDFGLAARANDLALTLSGGLRRRVELARALISSPEILLLDEPSTGLDPGVRREFWAQLTALRQSAGITILLTTHLMGEAELCDRIALMDGGVLVALDTPAALRARLGGDVITVNAANPERLGAEIEARFGPPVRLVDGALRLERPDAHRFVAGLAEAFPGRIDALTVARPTLEDVFLELTGRRLE